jgi:hypothetical protein
MGTWSDGGAVIGRSTVRVWTTARVSKEGVSTLAIGLGSEDDHLESRYGLLASLTR